MLQIFYCNTDAFAQQTTKGTKHPFLLGGYGEGLYLANFDSSTGSISPPELIASVNRGSFFTHHPNQDVWYCVGEGGNNEGSILLAFQVTKEPYALKEISRHSTGGQGPCYVSTDQAGLFAFVANYGDGSVSMFPINTDGSLSTASDVIKHVGQSVNPSRQKEPHAHCAVVDPSDRCLLVADLGIDLVKQYKIDRENKKLVEQSELNLKLPPGSGPRHLAFHPTLNFVYIINELTSTIAVASREPASGLMSIIQVVSTLPEGTDRNNTTAEILVHPSGNFVFGSNRGHDSIASFSVDAKNGTLAAAGYCSSGGKVPRNFRLDPTGDFILAENQNSNSVQTLRIDLTSGKLTTVGKPMTVPSPACIKFLPN